MNNINHLPYIYIIKYYLQYVKYFCKVDKKNCHPLFPMGDISI